MITKEAETYWVWIYIAGEINTIKQTCRQYCREGLCVTVEEVLYIYTGGEEYGVRIGLINYPRFPETKEKIWQTAMELATMIRYDACQNSFLVMDSEKSYWVSYKE